MSNDVYPPYDVYPPLRIIQNSFTAQKVLLYTSLKLQSFNSHTREKELQDSLTFLKLKLALSGTTVHSVPLPPLVSTPKDHQALRMSLLNTACICLSPPAPPTAAGLHGALMTFPH